MRSSSGGGSRPRLTSWQNPTVSKAKLTSEGGGLVHLAGTLLSQSEVQAGDHIVTRHKDDADAGPPDQRTFAPFLCESTKDRSVRHGRDYNVVGGHVEQERLP